MSRLSVILALYVLFGCKPAPPEQPPTPPPQQAVPPRELSGAPQPWDGEYVVRDEAGEIVQRTVWADHKLVSAWEVSERSPAKWKQVVKDGTGAIIIYHQGKPSGVNWFFKGEFQKGAG